MKTKVVFFLSLMTICFFLKSCSDFIDIDSDDSINDTTPSINYVYLNNLKNDEVYSQIKETFSNYNNITRSSTEEENLELDFINTFNFNFQEVLSDDKNLVKVVLVSSKNGNTINSGVEAQYLCSTINTEEQILEQKIVETEFDGDEVFVSFYDVYGTFCYKIKSNVKDKKMSVVEYNKDRYGNLDGATTRQSDLGCSASLMAASLPWTIGFGMVNPFAGDAAGVVFWGLSYLMC
jgi:hypothetical protein